MKVMKKIIISLFIFSAFTGIVFGDEVIKLSVDDAVALALENNISVKNSESSLKLAKRQKNSSWNSISPKASVSGTVTEDLEKSSESYRISGSLSASLSPSLFSSIKSAVLSYEAGELSYEKTLRSVELNVRKSFYSLLYSKENIALQERNLETAQKTYESNLSKYNRGQLSELDLLTSQYNVDSRKPVIESLKNSYQNNIANFKQIIGLALDKEIELMGDLADTINIKLSTDCLQTDLNSVPSVKSAQNSVDSAKNSLLATRFSAYAPSLTASYSYGKSGVELGDLNIVSNSLSIGVSIPLDGFLPWSSGALSVASQKEKLGELKLSLENEKTAAAISIRNSYNTIMQAQNQLETLKQNVNLMQRAYEMTSIAYSNGSKDLLALQTAADNLLNAKTSLQSGEYTLISSVLDLENTLGVPFGTFLAE